MKKTKSSNPQSISTTARLTITAMFGALAAILMLFELPIFFTLPFIKLDFSDIPVILGAYMLGPLWGCIIGGIKIALNFVLNGTVTAGIGEALITTVFGLCIAILGMCIHAWLSNQIKTETLNIYEVSSTLSDIIQAKNDNRKCC